MLQHERLKIITDTLKQEGKVDVNVLSELFSVSKVTIRKDLDILQEQGHIVRYYGGATLATEVLTEIPENKDDDMLKQKYKMKNLVAQRAASHVKSGDAIFLGSGITCTLLAEYLGDIKNLTVITNNISAVPKLLKNVERVIVIGGEIITIDEGVNYFSWTDSPDQYLANIFVDKVFTSCTGIDLRAGLTVNAAVSTYIFKCLPSIKREWFLLSDSSKFDNIGIYKFNTLDAIDYIISDSMPQSYLDFFAQMDIQTETCV